jgi:hypothetical protein
VFEIPNTVRADLLGKVSRRSAAVNNATWLR